MSNVSNFFFVFTSLRSGFSGFFRVGHFVFFFRSIVVFPVFVCYDFIFFILYLSILSLNLLYSMSAGVNLLVFDLFFSVSTGFGMANFILVLFQFCFHPSPIISSVF